MTALNQEIDIYYGDNTIQSYFLLLKIRRIFLLPPVQNKLKISENTVDGPMKINEKKMIFIYYVLIIKRIHYDLILNLYSPPQSPKTVIRSLLLFCTAVIAAISSTSNAKEKTFLLSDICSFNPSLTPTIAPPTAFWSSTHRTCQSMIECYGNQL